MDIVVLSIQQLKLAHAAMHDQIRLMPGRPICPSHSTARAASIRIQQPLVRSRGYTSAVCLAATDVAWSCSLDV